jgi:hypothetical protein
VALIGLQQQKITVYDSEGPILQAPVSSGARGYETPAGVFTILLKSRDHVSNLYDDAKMPFMQRMTGVALHAGALPGYRASHGCIRLPYTFAERLFDLTSVGTRVIIAPNKVDAIQASHPLLDSLQHAGASAASAESIEEGRRNAAAAKGEADAAAQRAESAMEAARRAEAENERAKKLLQGATQEAETKYTEPAMARAQAQLKKRQAEAAATLAASIAATNLAQATATERIVAEQRARNSRYRTWPLSIFVSRQTQRIYVRQGFEPVLEMPVAITDTETPIGTHAFYATEPGEGQRGWMAVSVSGSAAPGVQAALDRIEIPDAVARLLGRGVWTGSTLIVSDEPPHKETGAGTDFVVVLSTEPQGALKMRSPEAERPMAQYPGQPRVRAYRSASSASESAYRSAAPAGGDHHFRHPLGGGFP